MVLWLYCSLFTPLPDWVKSDSFPNRARTGAWYGLFWACFIVSFMLVSRLPLITASLPLQSEYLKKTLKKITAPSAGQPRVYPWEGTLPGKHDRKVQGKSFASDPIEPGNEHQ
jgi:hypothetical protein